jgi:hypothetical protein
MLGLALQPSNGVDMPKPCAVCAHKRRSEIDVELVSEPVNVSAIARQYDVSRKAVTNHRDTHLPGMLRRTVEVFSHAVDMPTVGQIGAEYMRLYLAALDALATAQAGTLIDLDDNGAERRQSLGHRHFTSNLRSEEDSRCDRTPRSRCCRGERTTDGSSERRA